MIIETIWCQRDNKWVRFVQEDGLIRAESARARRDYPSLAQEWQPEADGIWSADFDLGVSTQQRKTFYRLEGGVLYLRQPYRLLGEDGAKVSRFENKGRLKSHNTRTAGDPFASLTREEIELNVGLLSYENLPLTVETWKETWTEIQKDQNFFKRYLGELVTSLELGHKEMLYGELFLQIENFAPHNYESPVDFLALLEIVINEADDALHIQVLRTAAVTNVEEQLGINRGNDRQIGQILLKDKQDLFFGLLRAGAEFLRDTFGLHEQVAELDLGAVLEVVGQEPVPVVAENRSIEPLKEVKSEVGQVISTFFFNLWATFSQFIPNIFNWSKKPASGSEKIAKVGSNVDFEAERQAHMAPVDEPQERGLGAVSSPESSWLLRRKANELVQSSISCVSSLRSLFWSTPQPTGDDRNVAKPDKAHNAEHRF